MDQFIGKMLDNRYEILELIGSGGMANVYKAKCHRLNRLVAIKILKSDLAENADFRRRFRDESLAVAQLSHANIVSLYDVSSSDGIEYIVMELIEGITLKQYMERRGQLDWREALHFITQIMRGLSHAHSRGIIHRDIKPQNIMVLRDGSVKVADFGIACLANTSQTLTQEALGSVHYISPEQARGDRTDARSDVYSAGVVLYEMLTGRLPFEGDSAVSVAIQHLSSTPLNPRDINPAIPEQMELICMKAMNADREKRYASADAMLEDLERYRKDPTVDMEHIRREMAAPVDEQPTMAVPTAEVNAVVNTIRHRQEAAEKPFLKDNKHKYLLILAIVAALALVVAVFLGVSSGFQSNDGSYEVPNLVGKTVEQAENMDGVKGIFTLTVAGYRSNTGYEPGQIVEQNPPAGRLRKSNLVINVYVSSLAETVAIPDVLGEEYRVAKTTLQNMGFGLSVIRGEDEYSDDYAYGQVMSVEPEVEAAVSRGTAVTLIVSKGQQHITMVSFENMTEEAATQMATEMGLTVGKTEYDSHPRYEPGTVIKQSIPVGDTVSGGTEIVFTVCGENNNVVVPVDFTLPEELNSKTNVRVDLYKDGNLVETEFISGANSAIRYQYEGTRGDKAEVYATFDGIATSKQVIYFD